MCVCTYFLKVLKALISEEILTDQPTDARNGRDGSQGSSNNDEINTQAGELEKRKEKRDQAQEALDKAKEEGNMEEVILSNQGKGKIK